MVPWSLEQVLAIAPARTGAARPIAVPALWDATGADERALWGRFRGGSGEPYQVSVDHSPAVIATSVGGGSALPDLHDIGSRCTCPSRVTPCKHSIALLVLWAGGHVPEAPRPPAVQAWLRQRDAVLARVPPTPARPAATPSRGTAVERTPDDVTAPPGSSALVPPPGPNRGSDDRRQRVAAGLRELERWIDDRARVGLADPSIARYATWDELATRLVDAQVPGLANRVRRLAGHVGARPGWHEHVLAELGVLHLLARAGGSLDDLGDPWSDGVASAIGFTVKQADVRAGVPETARWVVVGRSDVVEDRIVVRRLWLRDAAASASPCDAPDALPAERSQGWALLLSFAAYGQSLDTSLTVGQWVDADLHRYPGTVPLRALIGTIHDSTPDPGGRDLRRSAAASIAAAADSIGSMLALEPWLERVPVVLVGAPTVVDGHWAFADHSGALPVADPAAGGSGDWATVLAASAGRPVAVMGEWTALGLVVLAVQDSGSDHPVLLDVGPRGGFR